MKLTEEAHVLKIIDRKKDLVKAAGGEYVSYGKIEPLLKDCPLVDNVVVYQDPSKAYCIALVTVPPKQDPPAPEEDVEVETDVRYTNAFFGVGPQAPAWAGHLVRGSPFGFGLRRP